MLLILIVAAAALASVSNAQEPQLQMFGISLAPPEQIAMMFDIAVDASSCDVTEMTLYSSSNIGSASSYTPTSGTCTSDPMGLLVSLSSQDWQAIKNDPMLALSVDTTYLTLTENFISSAQGGTPNQALSTPIQASFYAAAPSALTVQTTLLDLDTGTLLLQFDSAVSNFDATGISLMNGNYSLSLSGGVNTPIVPAMSNITYQLPNNEWIALKLAFGSSVNFTSWTITIPANAASSGDLTNSQTTMSLGGLIPDSTSPEVSSIMLDMDTGVINIQFNEAIDSMTYNPGSVYLVNSDTQPFLTNYSLSDSSVNQSVDLLSFTITLSSDLLLQVKADETIGTALSNTFLYLAPESFSDYASNLIAPSTMSNVLTSFVPDTTGPFLISFQVSLDLATMDLTFSEPIKRSSFNASAITLLDSAMRNSLPLSSEQISTSFSVFQTTLNVAFSAQQINDIKLLLFNAGSNSLLLTMTEIGCSDTSDNPVTPISDVPLPAASVVPDTRHPSLISYSPDQYPPVNYSMNFTFSEYVDPDSFNPASLVLTLITSSGSTVFNTFNGGEVTNLNYLTISYRFNVSALGNNFPILYQIAYYSGNMTATFGSDLVTDLNGNIVITPPEPVLFISQESDPISPALQGFTLDLVQGSILLTFSEPVLLLGTTNSLQLENRIQGGITVSFDSSFYSGLQGMTGISFQISLVQSDIDSLLSNDLIATGTDNTFLSISQDFAVDYSGNRINNTVPLQALNVLLPASASVMASTSTSLLATTSSVLVATSTTAVTSSITATSTISPTPSSTEDIATITSTILSSTVTSTESMFTSMLILPSPTSSSDIFSSLASTESTVTPSSSTASSSMLTASSSESLSTTVIESSTATASSGPTPTPIASINITEAGLDMDRGLLNITFSAPVSFLNFAISGNIILSNGSESVTLSGDNGFETGSPLRVFLNNLDLNLLKSRQVSADWSVTILAGAFVDVNGASNLLQILPLDNFVFDQTPPSLFSSQLDMNIGRLILTFNEAIPANFIDISAIYINNATVNSPPSQHSLSGVLSSSVNDSTVTIVLTAVTLNQIKTDATTATGRDNSFIFISGGALQDYNSNAIQMTSVQVNAYVPDITSPVLASYQLDLDSSIMTVTFSEAIDAGSIDTIGSVISKSQPITLSADIIGSLIGTSNQNTVVSLFVQANINEIKLALYESSTAYISVPQSFAIDTAGNPLTEIDISSPLAASVVVADTFAPTVTGFSPNASSPDMEYITFTFSEYVALSSISESSLVITLNNTLVNQTYDSFTGGLWSASPNNGTAVYQFSQSDRQQQSFGLNYLFSTNAGQVSVFFGSGLATDLNSNPVTAPNMALVYTATQQDVTQPSLQSFVVDLDTGRLTMSFTENVVLLLVPGNIQFQNRATNPTAVYTLISSSYNSQIGSFGSSITVTLDPQDTGSLLNDTDIANNITDTFLLLGGELVADYSSNTLSISGPIQASNVITPFTPDNPPVLQSAAVDLNDGSLLLTFDTSLDLSLVMPSSISLVNGGIIFSLDSSANVSQLNDNSTAIRVLMSANDMSSAKFLLLTYNDPWSISLSSNAVRSTEGGGNLPQTLQIDMTITDTTRPSAVSYTFDLDSGWIVVTFNEPVSNITYNSSGIWLSNAVSTQPMGLSLSDSEIVTSSISNTLLTIQLPMSMLNIIKANSSLATAITNTFLFFTADSFQDLSSNGLIASVQSSQPTIYTQDVTSPILVNFTLDLNTGILSLSFDEIVIIDSLDMSQITLYNSDLSSSLIISDYSVLSSGFDATVNIRAQGSSLNGVKVLLSGSSIVRLSITSSAITDAASNGVTAISNSDPLQSSQVIPDTTSPSLISLIAGDPTLRTLEMMFSEYVQSSSWNGAGLTLYLNTSVGQFTFTGFTDGTVSATLSNNLTYTISESKFQQESLDIRYQQAYYSGSVGISLSSLTVTDLSGNGVVEPASPVYYFSMQTDPIVPQLTSFELNLDTARLTLIFSEPVILYQIPGHIRIQNTANSPTLSRNITSSSYSTQEGATGTNITIVLELTDVINIASTNGLGSTVSNTYLYLDANLAVDYSGNFLQVPANALQAASVADYTGQLNPQVTSFDLDLDSDQMTLHFSSPVNVSTLMPSRITLLNSTTISLQSQLITLSNITLIAQGEQSDFRFLMSIQDVINIKRHPLCYTTANCYAMFDQGLAVNSINLPSISTQPIQVASLTQDVTPPRFLSFPIFDLNSGLFTIIFSEPINGSSTDFTSVTFSNSLSNPTQTVTLTEGFTSPDHVEIDFHLHRDDLNALKYRLQLCTSRDNCWVKLPSFFVSDIGSNPFLHSNYQPGAVASYHQPTVFISDTTPPVLEAISVDMNQGQLVLSFDEVIDKSLFIASDVTLLNAVSGELSLTLSNTTAFDRINTGTALQLTFTTDDLNWIKARDMFSSTENSYLYLITNMADISGNTFNDISPSSARKASTFIADTTQIQLLSFDSFNLDNGSFFVSFNEPVQVTSINLTGISLASGIVGSPVSYRLSGGNATAANVDGLTVRIDLARSDRVAIKLLPSLATSDSNTYIYLDSSVVNDTAGNPNSPLPISSAIRLRSGGFTSDTSLAALMSSELDMDQGQLKLTFNDVIKADSIVTQLISIQNKSATGPDSSSYTLSSDSTASTENSDVIYITLHQTDLNSIKANLYLATQANNSYIAFPTTAAQDIEERNVIGISETASHQVVTYIADTTSPVLSSYSIDLDAGTLILSMSEPVLLQSFTPTELRVQNSASSPTSSYTLSAGTVAPQTSGVVADSVITLTLDYTDLNEIKSRTALATSSSDTFLNVGSGSFSDTSRNNIVSVPGMSPDSYSGDVTLPVLVAFSLDLRSQGKIILHFSEAVRYTSNLQSTIMLQNRLTNPTVTLSLTSAEPAVQTSLDEVMITLSNTHSNQLLTDSDIAETSSSLYISMSPGGIYDYSTSQGQSIASVTQKVTNLYRTCFDANTYNNASLGTCESCHSSCVGGCTGSMAIAATGGCGQCEVIILDANGNQVTCLSPGSQCPTKYYADTRTLFAGLTSNGRLCRPCHDTCATCDDAGEDSCTSCQTAFILNSFGTLSQCTTSCPPGNSSDCRYCDNQCNGCTGPENTDCVSCLGTTRTNTEGQTVCAPDCTSDQYQSAVNDDFVCVPCHSQCLGCTGPSNTQCRQCRNVNNTFTSINECTAVCPFGSYRDDFSKCRSCDQQCNGCTGPSSSNCTVCTESSIVQATGELVCVPSCMLWQEYDLSSSSCMLTTGAQMAVIVASSATGGILLVLAILVACCCVFRCRKKYKLSNDIEITGGASFVRGSYLKEKTTSI